MANVVRLYLRPSSRTPVQNVENVQAVAGQGLEGDHARGGNRQVTLMEKAGWEAACRELGRDDLDPGGRRANIVIEGLALGSAIKQRLRVGECLIEVVRRNPPCRLMDDFAPGLMEALSPDHRSGVFGKVLEGGRIEVGSPVSLDLPADSGG